VNLVNGSTICAITPWSRASIASVGYLRDQLRDVIGLLELIEKAVTCRVHSLPGFDAVPPDKIIVCADEDETDDGDQQHRAPDHREE